MKTKFRFIFFILVPILLISCIGYQREIIVLKSVFNEDEAKRILEEGNNKIVGSALIRQQGGGIVSCAGCEVLLYPATDYAKERIMYLYGNTDKGYNDINAYRRNYTVKRGDRLSGVQAIPIIEFTPDFKSYHSYTRKTIGDAQGNFEFDKVADGAYFIFTTIYWQVHNAGTQGGSLMYSVSVVDGETKKVVLAP